MLKEAKVSEILIWVVKDLKMVWKGMQLAGRGVKTVAVVCGGDCNVEESVKYKWQT